MYAIQIAPLGYVAGRYEPLRQAVTVIETSTADFLKNENLVCIASLGDPLFCCKPTAKKLQTNCKETASQPANH